MFKLVLLVSFVAGALGAAVSNGLSGRIVGGQEAGINQFPYQISLMNSGHHSCGGSVYSDSIILTAAHCVAEADVSTLTIRAGSIDRTSGGVVVNVAKILAHPKFSTTTIVNDIALLKLAAPLPLGPNIRPIKLVKNTPIEGSSAVVSGWGVQKHGTISSPTILRYANLKIINREVCSSKTYSYGTDIRSTMICAAAPGEGSCQMDSGGPLVVEDGQAGIVSWGNGCAEKDYPGVYTDVAVLRPWILKNIATL